MRFEKVTHNDLDNISHLQPDGWSEIISSFRYYIDSVFCHPIKTIVNNKIVGIGTSIIFRNTIWIAHIIVDMDHRKRGIGSSIVEKLLKDLKSNSIDTCLLIATELGQPIYKQAGFRNVSKYLFFKRDKPLSNLLISNNVMPVKDEFYSTIIELDKKISGENRETLLCRYIENSIVFIKNDELIGHYIPGLGEGLIIADNAEAGIELMKVKYSKINEAVIPLENTAGIEFLQQSGFTETKTKATRMILGKDINWKPKKIFSRIGGNFG